MRGKIKHIYVVTSDFHMKRSKYNFDAMFFNENKQMIGNAKEFKYEERVHFESSGTKWENLSAATSKQKKEEKYYNSSYLQQQTITAAKRLW
eukprot:263699_1